MVLACYGLPSLEQWLRLAAWQGLIDLARQIEPIVNGIRGLLE